jgi:hypothetical protein
MSMREWLYPAAVLVVTTVLLSFGISGSSDNRRKPRDKPWLGALSDMLIGADGRWSTSKTMFTLWTYAVAYGLLSILFLRNAVGLTDNGLDGSYLFLLGFPVGSAVIAKQITVASLANGDLFKEDGTPSGNPLTDLTGDDGGKVDLGDLQYVLFNLIGLAYFFYLYNHNAKAGLPKLPSTVVLLISVSAVAYIGKKALAKTIGPVLTSLSVSSGKAGDNVFMDARNLVDPDKPLTDPSNASVLVVFTPRVNGKDDPSAEIAVPPTGPLGGTSNLTRVSVTVPAMTKTAYSLRLANYLGVRSNPERFTVQ